MQHPFRDLLRPALVEEVGAEVAADTAADVHPLLIAVAAHGALPQKLPVLLHDLDLTVIAAGLTVIRLGI